MFSKRAVLLAIVIAALGVHATHSALAQTWVGTWTASPHPPRGVMPASFSNQTVARSSVSALAAAESGSSSRTSSAASRC